jgi:hypothetical protein
MVSKLQNTAVLSAAAALVPVACMFAATQLLYATDAYQYRGLLSFLGHTVGFVAGLVVFSRIRFASRASRFFATGAYVLGAFVLLAATQVFTACGNGDCS